MTVKAGEQISTKTASLEQAQKEAYVLEKEKDAGTRELDKQRESNEHAVYERAGLKAKLQRGHRDREKCADAVNRVRGGVRKLRGLVKKDSVGLQKHMDEHWVLMCQHLGTLLAERVVEASEDQIREFRSVAEMYVQSWKSHLKPTKQLVKKPPLVGDAQVESLGPGSVNNGGSDDAPTSQGEEEFDADTGPSSL